MPGGIVALAVAALTLRPFFFMHGAPAMRHDWAWPLTRTGVWAMTSDLSAVISAANWDSPAWVPRVSPFQGVLWALNALCAPQWTLNFFLLILLAVAAFGAWRLARFLGAAPLLAALAALVFTANPYVVDELVAGHLWLLAGFATMPYVLRSLLDGRNPWEQAWWMALSSIDIHYLGFDLIFIAVALVVHRGNVTRIGGGLAGMIAFLPAIAGAETAHAGSAFLGQRALPYYNYVNSSAPADALRATGYFAHYDQYGRSALSSIALWIFPLLALAAALRKRYLPLVLVLGGAILAAGVRGPLAPLYALVFSHAAAASVYREIFDFTAITTLGAALAVAYLPQQRYLRAAAIAAIALAVWPAATASYAPLLKGYAPPAQALALLERIENTPGTQLALAYPVQSQVALTGYHGGLDPVSGRIGSHGLIDSTFDMPALARSIVFGGHERQDALLAHDRIGFIITRPGWVSQAADLAAPRFERYARSKRPGNEGAWTLRQLPASQRVWIGAARLCALGDLGTLNAGSDVVFASDNPSCGGVGFDLPLPKTPYPQDGWTLYDPLWYLQPWAANAFEGSIFTSARTPAPLPQGCDPGATYAYPALVRHGNAAPQSFEVTARGCRAPGLPSGTIVLSGPVRLGAQTRRVAPKFANVRVERDDRWSVTISGNGLGSGLLVLASTFSPYWKIELQGADAGPHLRADARFNAWVVRMHGPFRARFTYAPAALIRGLEILAGLLFAISLCGWMFSTVRSGANADRRAGETLRHSWEL